MKQETSAKPAPVPTEYAIPEWFQEDEEVDELGVGDAPSLPDIFNDLSGLRPPGEPVSQLSAPREEGVEPSVWPGAQRLFEIGSALGFMARTLRGWDHEGAEGVALILTNLAQEVAGIAATLPPSTSR